jgi:glycosyltransferase involved in cell wall biosynthesis
LSFLEILTRTIPQRAELLRRCQDSLTLLKDTDWTQRVIIDTECRGVAWANRNYSTIEAVGEWVWLLDDDDLCSNADLIGILRKHIAAQKPEAILMRAYHGKWGLLPPAENWGERPILGRIGPSCLVVRGDIWNQYRDEWVEAYAGDFWFINALWNAGVRFAWLPVVAAYQPTQNYGAVNDAR